MAAIEKNLFTWRDVEARSDLDRFYLVRDQYVSADQTTSMLSLFGLQIVQPLLWFR